MKFDIGFHGRRRPDRPEDRDLLEEVRDTGTRGGGYIPTLSKWGPTDECGFSPLAMPPPRDATAFEQIRARVLARRSRQD